MKNTATIHDDGTLTIAAEVLLKAGFQPGEQVEFSSNGQNLVLFPTRKWNDVFLRFAGIDRSRAPMSMDEIVAEQRELRGHDDLD